MLGPTLKALRLKKRLTLRQLASQIGVSAVYLHQMERDYSKPSDLRITQLATALDADAERLSLLAGRVPNDVLTALYNKPSWIESIRLDSDGSSASI